MVELTVAAAIVFVLLLARLPGPRRSRRWPRVRPSGDPSLLAASLADAGAVVDPQCARPSLVADEPTYSDAPMTSDPGFDAGLSGGEGGEGGEGGGGDGGGGDGGGD
jgi:hypothetical protein